MSQNSKTQSGQDHANRPGDDKVITPAGEVPKDRVHRVGPGEEVRRRKDGSLEVIPKGTHDPDRD